MKQKNNKISHLNLEYLFEIAQRLPRNLAKRKSKEFIDLANKQQTRIGKIKRTMCYKCKSILIPKVNSIMSMEKKEQGFGLSVNCLVCNSSKFFVKRKHNLS